MARLFKLLVSALAAGLTLTLAFRAMAGDPSFVFIAASAGDYEIGEPIRIEWQAAGIPEGASLVLGLSLLGAEPLWMYEGASGSLTLTAIPLADGPGSFVWDGKGVACAPTDAPMFCRLDPGDYRLMAAVYAPGRVYILPSMLGTPKNPEVITHAELSTIVLRGAPDSRRLLYALRSYASGAFINLVVPNNILNRSLPEVVKRYAREESPPRETAERTYCLKFTALDPFTGWVEACQRLRHEPTIRSELALKPGIPTLVAADELARDLVTGKYAGKARPELGTKVTINRNKWVYKSKVRTARPHWGIEYYVGEVGGRGASDRFAAVVYVKVFNDGTTEMLELPRIPNSSGTTVDIWKDDI